MKTLIVFYSFQGRTRDVAKIISRETKGDLLEITPRDRVEAEKFMSYYWSGENGIPEKRIELENFILNPSDYDLIFIGTPVWAWSPSPPVHSFLVEADLNGKDVALFATSEGDPGSVFTKMRKHLDNSRVISQAEFIDRDSMDEIEIRKKVLSWARITRRKAEAGG
jgi:flavodoxin